MKFVVLKFEMIRRAMVHSICQSVFSKAIFDNYLYQENLQDFLTIPIVCMKLSKN